MTRKKSNIGRATRNVRRISTRKATETPQQKETRLEANRIRASTLRAAETVSQRNVRLADLRARASNTRAAEKLDERSKRLDDQKSRQIKSRTRKNLNKEAFNYNKDYNYQMHRDIKIGSMNIVCPYCHALKFKKETAGMCCSNGKVILSPLDDPPEPLLTYVTGITKESKYFLQHIRKYNSCFQMTSFGATNIVKFNNFMPTFKVQRQVYHQIGSLLPLPEENPQFLQIYFMDNVEKEIDRRSMFSTNTNMEIITKLQIMLHEHNYLIKDFKSTLEGAKTDDFKVIIKADKTPLNEHEKRFNAPIAPEVAAVIVGTEIMKRDIVITKRDKTKHRVAETHRSYDSLQYPILFPRAEDGYHFKLYQTNPTTGALTSKRISCMDFYAYRIMIRKDQSNLILKCRQLFQQFIVDMYAKVESERLNYLRYNQPKLRTEEYIHLRDTISNDKVAADIGQRVILPSSYTGSPRHMQEYAQDALAYVRKNGCPDLFITFTCNPSWEEIKDLLSPGQQPSDRHDLIARVFKQKLIRLMDLITKNHLYGETCCWMYSIEWQKRGLPHAHILIWLVEKIVSNKIDDIISAELPNKREDPELFEIIKKSMVHGPCGSYNPDSPCMKDGKCTKGYPRQLLKETQTGGDGYPLYRRRKPVDGGHTAVIKIKNMIVKIDNQWIVPYTPILSKSFNAHINVEICNSNGPINEIDQFQIGRYISSNEAVWRILGFDIHERFPTVTHLSVHLENGQRVYFTEENAAQKAMNLPNTTLTAFFNLCATDKFAKTLLYNEVPQFYTWNQSTKQFYRRKQGIKHPSVAGIFSTSALGRVYTVHPSNSECYYLRMLLHVIKGPTSFQAIKTIDGQECQTYREACFKLGMLEHDQHWNDTLTEASETCHPHQIRTLFAIILTTCAPSNPKDLWEKHKESMSEDILLRERQDNPNLDIQYSEDIFNKSLILLEDICGSINNKNLDQLGLFSPKRNGFRVLDRNVLMEKQYDVNALHIYVETYEKLLTNDQRLAYNSVMDYVQKKMVDFFFLMHQEAQEKLFC